MIAGENGGESIDIRQTGIEPQCIIQQTRISNWGGAMW